MKQSMEHGTISGTRNIEGGTLEHSLGHFKEQGTRSIPWNMLHSMEHIMEHEGFHGNFHENSSEQGTRIIP